MATTRFGVKPEENAHVHVAADGRSTVDPRNLAIWRWPAALGLLVAASVAVVSPNHVSVIMTVLVAAGCYLAARRSLRGGSPGQPSRSAAPFWLPVG